jgi:hypothetical protein
LAPENFAYSPSGLLRLDFTPALVPRVWTGGRLAWGNRGTRRRTLADRDICNRTAGRSAKVEASLLYDFGPVAVGLGWREEVSGAFEEKGWLVSAWRSF